MILRRDLLALAGKHGFLYVGRNHLQPRGWYVAFGFCRKLAPPCEIQWRWHFEQTLTAPALIYYEPDYFPRWDGGGEWLSRRWTGRDRELAGVRWFGRVWMIGGGA